MAQDDQERKGQHFASGRVLLTTQVSVPICFIIQYSKRGILHLRTKKKKPVG